MGSPQPPLPGMTGSNLVASPQPQHAVPLPLPLPLRGPWWAPGAPPACGGTDLQFLASEIAGRGVKKSTSDFNENDGGPH